MQVALSREDRLEGARHRGHSNLRWHIEGRIFWSQDFFQAVVGALPFHERQFLGLWRTHCGYGMHGANSLRSCHWLYTGVPLTCSILSQLHRSSPAISKHSFLPVQNAKKDAYISISFVCWIYQWPNKVHWRRSHRPQVSNHVHLLMVASVAVFVLRHNLEEASHHSHLPPHSLFHRREHGPQVTPSMTRWLFLLLLGWVWYLRMLKMFFQRLRQLLWYQIFYFQLKKSTIVISRNIIPCQIDEINDILGNTASCVSSSLLFFITLKPRVDWYTTLCDLNTSPPRNYFIILRRGCSETENCTELYNSQVKNFRLIRQNFSSDPPSSELDAGASAASAAESEDPLPRQRWSPAHPSLNP